MTVNVEFKDIEEAYSRIKDVANHTPIMTSRTLNKMVDASVFLKCENYQRGGAFKFRGALNAISLLSDEQKKNGVITHSSGNHAQALAIASSQLGIKSTVVMPKSAPIVKQEATKGYGAEVILCEPTLASRVSTTNELIKKNGYTLIHSSDNDKIIAGAGTAAYELIKEIGDIDFIFCPVGGGGLLSGTSIAVKKLCPNAKIIAVEPQNADDAYRSFKDGKLYSNINPHTIADGLIVSLSERTFAIIKENVDEIITVSDKEIVDAMKFLWMRMKMVVEPSGAVSVAGLIKIKEKIKDKKVGAIISGGNVDLEQFFKKYYDQI